MESTSYVLARCQGAAYAGAVASTIGANIIRLREAAGLKTQAALAKALDVPQPQVSDWENDRYPLLDTKNLIKLATLFNCSIDELLAGVDAQYDRAIRRKMADLRDTLERMAEPFDPSDESADFDRLYDAQTVQRAIDEILRDRDLASRVGAVRDAAAAFATTANEDERLVLTAYRQATEKDRHIVHAALGISVSSALAQNVALRTATKAGQNRHSPAEPQVVGDASAPVASSSTVDLRDLKASARTSGGSIVEDVKGRERERKVQVHPVAKPKRRAGHRSAPRRRD